MSEIKTKIRTYNDVIDLFGEEKAADMLSEALGWSTIDPKNDKKNIMERKPLLLDPYMTYEDEDYCKHIVAGFLGDRDLDWASGYIDEEKIKNGQVMPADLKSALSMALDNELSTSWAYLDALSSQCAEICNKFAVYIESAGLASGVLVPGEYELDHDALNADVSERFNIQYEFQCDQMIDAMQFDMTLILTEKVDSMDGYRLIQSVCDWREDILEGHVRDYAVPFGNVYHLDSPGYVSEERWCDTLPSDRERSTFMALQNGVSTKEIIEHKDEFGWIDRMAMSSVADDYAECYMTQAGPDYLDEQEIMNVREQYPELIDSNGEIVWNDPDFMKRGVTFDVENFGEKYKLELVCDSYLDNGSLYVGAYDVTPESDNFGERWADISVNLNNPCQNDRTVFLDMNNLYNPAIIEAIYGLGTVEGIVSHSGFCSYPAFTFDADVISQMRNTQEFMDANTPDDYKLVAVKVGYNFALVPKIELSGIETNATETIVDISGKQYGLLAGRTFEDSQKLDAVLDAFPEYAIKDYKVPNKISVFIMPVQMYWKDDPSEIIETNFSFEDTCGLVIDDSVTFSGYTQNELVDMIGREDNGEDFVITGVGAGHYVGTCKKEPSKNKSVSEKTCNARESSGRLDADRNVDRNDIAKDKEVK